MATAARKLSKENLATELAAKPKLVINNIFTKAEKLNPQELIPLMSMVGINIAIAYILVWQTAGSFQLWVHYFVGLLLCSSALLKFMDMKKFADGYEMYDVIASNFRVYGYIYPFIELELGLGFMAFTANSYVTLIALPLLTISFFGAATAIYEGTDTKHASYKTILNIPLPILNLAINSLAIFMSLLLLAIQS